MLADWAHSFTGTGNDLLYQRERWQIGQVWAGSQKQFFTTSSTINHLDYHEFCPPTE